MFNIVFKLMRPVKATPTVRNVVTVGCPDVSYEMYNPNRSYDRDSRLQPVQTRIDDHYAFRRAGTRDEQTRQYPYGQTHDSVA
jgi:hypothetical protein